MDLEFYFNRVKVQSQIDRLKRLVLCLRNENVHNHQGFKAWVKRSELFMNNVFEYEKLPGMPSITTLVDCDFHPTLPLVIINYTSAAHNTLHAFPLGWTHVLRWCRGIVFDWETVDLVAIPFKKFFNYGKHPETAHLPDDCTFEATVKQDGHLGIMFAYRGQVIITTRGRFSSKTTKLAQEMVNDYPKLIALPPEGSTLLVEIIHPDTRVFTNYDGQKKFILIGAINNTTFEDYWHASLEVFGQEYGIEVTPIMTGKSIQDLIDLMASDVENMEGVVVRYPGGRVKLKTRNHIGKMVAAKLSYTYLLNRMKDGNVQRMIDTLPEEIYDEALRMLGRIAIALSQSTVRQDKKRRMKEQWTALYSLEQGENATAYFKSVCRDYVKSLHE
jgi:hypothetical protein